MKHFATLFSFSFGFYRFDNELNDTFPSLSVKPNFPRFFTERHLSA